MVSSGPISSTSRPVSSRTSRIAVSATVSPGSWAPLGRVHWRVPLTERWATSATGASGLGWASTTPPAETARAVRTVSFPAW
jgi:hypothetical protein